jgi:hypothetical protein
MSSRSCRTVGYIKVAKVLSRHFLKVRALSDLLQRKGNQLIKKMQSAFASFLFFSLVFCASAQYQLDPEHYYKDNVQQRENPHPSFDVEKVDERFIKTVSLTLSTTTITSTTTAISTCTTSTAGLSVCTASGRRRRGLNLSGNKEGRGLFYNENEELAEEGSIFLPSPAK